MEMETINGPGDWQFDTPSAGLLYQAATSDDGGYGVDDLPDGGPGLAAAELDASQGYFVEWSMDLVSSSDGPGWRGYNIGNFMWLEDSARQHIIFSGADTNTDISENYAFRRIWSRSMSRWTRRSS